MERDKVVPLRQGTLIPEITFDPNPELILELEELLKEARTGHLAGIAYATLYSDNAVGNRYVGYLSRGAVGSLFAVMTRVSEQLDE